MSLRLARSRRFGLRMSPSASSVSFREALLSFLFIFFIAIVALSNLVPPTVVPASAPATDFSAEHAIEHLKVIARVPHPTGSIANALVRDNLISGMRCQHDRHVPLSI